MGENVKTVPISGRIAEDDYTFLMQYPVGGKVTASEKLRHVAAFFRQYQENMRDYGECLNELNRLLEGFTKEMKTLENEKSIHSELLDRMLTFVPKVAASLITAQLPEEKGKDGTLYLRELEERVLRMTLQLLESILRMALTRESPTYNPQLLRGRLGTVMELVDMVSGRETVKLEEKEEQG